MNITQNPLVSVVLAVHRENPYFPQALGSLLNQTLKEIEVIIVANNCSDEYFEKLDSYIKSLNDSRILVPRISLGQHGNSLNYGLMMARSNFVARMDYDDVCHPERLEKQYKFLMANPNVGILGTAYSYIDEAGNLIKDVKPVQNSQGIRRIIPFQNPFCHPSVMMRRDKILKLSGYSGGLFSEDYGLWIRASRDANFEFRNLDDVLLQYRISPSQSRGMRLSYAEVAGLLYTEALYRKSFIYFIGAVYSSFKIVFGRK